jgi:hypothetical protein
MANIFSSAIDSLASIEVEAKIDACIRGEGYGNGNGRSSLFRGNE